MEPIIMRSIRLRTSVRLRNKIAQLSRAFKGGEGVHLLTAP